MEDVTVDVQVAATDGDPVLYDISYRVQYLRDIKAKFISAVDQLRLENTNRKL